MATIPSIPSLPSMPEEPGFWDSLTNEGAKAFDRGSDLYNRGSNAFDTANGLYDRASGVPGRAGELSDAGADGLDKARGLLDKSDSVPGLGGLGDQARGRADDAADAKRQELEQMLADLEDSPDVSGAADKAAAKRQELEQMLADLEDGPSDTASLPLVGPGTDGFFDQPPAEAPEEEEAKAPEMATGDDDAASVVLVCRNLLNTLDTRASGYFWFSA